VTGFYNLQRCRQPVMQSGAFGYVQVFDECLPKTVKSFILHLHFFYQYYSVRFLSFLKKEVPNEWFDSTKTTKLPQ
jgi:hypothetical protein